MDRKDVIELRNAHEARRSVYGAPSAMNGRKKAMFREQKRRTLKQMGPQLALVKSDQGDEE